MGWEAPGGAGKRSSWFCSSPALCSAQGERTGHSQPATAAFIPQSCLLCRNSSAKSARELAKSTGVDLTFHLCLCFLNRKTPNKLLLLSRDFIRMKGEAGSWAAESSWLRAGSPGSPNVPWERGIHICLLFLSKGSETSQLCQRELPLGAEVHWLVGRVQELTLHCQMEPWHRPGTGSGSAWHCSAIPLQDADFPLWTDARGWGQQLVM